MMQSINSKAPIVGMGGNADATKTTLWPSLWTTLPAGTVAQATNNMPYTLLYQFKPQDMMLIRAWIQAGAPNN
jgi:hypothetical protein